VPRAASPTSKDGILLYLLEVTSVFNLTETRETDTDLQRDTCQVQSITFVPTLGIGDAVGTTGKLKF
jgi:hypothetical protein